MPSSDEKFECSGERLRERGSKQSVHLAADGYTLSFGNDKSCPDDGYEAKRCVEELCSPTDGAKKLWGQSRDYELGFGQRGPGTGGNDTHLEKPMCGSSDSAELGSEM